MGLLLLCLLVLCCCAPCRSEFMVLGGPRLQLNEGAVPVVPECSALLQENLQEELRTLRGAGVSHFRVQLPREALHSEAPLSCLQTLLFSLTRAGLQPVVLVDLSWVSSHGPAEAVFPGYRPASELVLQSSSGSGERGLDVVFAELGGLADTWVLLLDGNSPNDVELYSDVYQIFRRHFPDTDHRVSLGLKSSDLSSLTFDPSDLPMDFLSVRVDCEQEDDSLSNIKKLFGDVPVLIYDTETSHCPEQQLLGQVIRAQIKSEVNIVGCDAAAILDQNTDQSIVSVPKDSAPWRTPSLPAGFQWAVSSAAFKVEGGWRAGNKGETIWDRFGHQQEVKGQSCDVACDSYNKVAYDLYLLRGLNVDSYHFSISWARLLPSGTGAVSEAGAQYYDTLIDGLLESGIRPLVSLFHWDLPQTLQDSGGWTNPSIVQAFRDYADLCFSRYGDRVKDWTTFSSPWTVSHAGYGTGQHPPGIKDYRLSAFQATHNILKAHAEAWHLYDDRYRAAQRGEVGIALNSDWAQPLDPNNAEDQAAAQRYLQMMLGWFAHPVFIDGDYPPQLKSQIQLKATECPDSPAAVLPEFTAEEKHRIRGTADFFGLTHYTSRLVSHKRAACGGSGPEALMDYETHIDPNWTPTESDWIYLNPDGLRQLLRDISQTYLSERRVPLYLSGVGTPSGYDTDILNDTIRADYISRCVEQALRAVAEDHVDLRRFTVQSLMDGFEGPQGYRRRFGLHYVDFSSADRPRTPKLSAYVYSRIIQQQQLRAGEDTPPSSPPVSFSPALKHLNASEVPSKSKVVWEKFSPWTKFQRRMYHYGTFPQDFLWGVMSAAYQIEGGWEADGKGRSIWDTFTHLTPSPVPESANGDVACDSYNKVEQDLSLIKALEVQSYRFSISWPRLFPDGTAAALNQKGLDYYNKLIDGLLSLKVTPVVTLYHWDLPQALQDVGGWENATMVDHFNAYAEFCFKTFGDRVKFWITFNDPFTIAWKGYGSGEMPPNLKANPGVVPYQVGHILIKAHAAVYHTYETYRPTQRGLVSIALNGDWYEPLDVNVPRELEAVDRAMQFRLGWFAHPIFKNGDYPEAMKFQVGAKSDLQRLKESRLPTFTKEEKAFIRGTADVFCVNHHTTKIAKYSTQRLTPHSYQYDWDVIEQELTDYPETDVKDKRAVAWGLRRVLNWIKQEYGDPEVYVTENGAATDRKVSVDDPVRMFFLKTYIDEALKAQSLDGVRLRGYLGAPLMDSFEWLQGYTVGSGLTQVDFTKPERPRTPKYSSQYYYKVLKENGFPPGPDETPQYGHFRDDMIWSTATASYQIEGGWLADGKGLSIWDKFAHTPLRVFNDATGDVACDSYHKIHEDLEMLKQLGVNHYRFSISWSRVMPDGTTATINEPGLQYYDRLVEALLQAGIQPHITLYHWDLPQALQDIGGWENVTIVDRFRDYADLMFRRLGPKVKRWITINEPYNIAMVGHGYGTAAPGISFRPGTLPYIVAHHLIKAHAEAWHLYNGTYRASQGGTISITINSDWAEPRNPTKQEDIDAAQRVIQFYIGWFAHPIFVGDYSPTMKTIIEERSLAAGLPKSRLPEFTPEEIVRIKGAHDYFCFNHYTTVLAFPVDYNNLQHYDADRGAGVIPDRTWLDSGSGWLKVAPFGFRRILNFIKNNYGNPPIIITENGVSQRGAVELNDTLRQHFYTEYINQVLKAYLLDGVDIRGYTAWTLMDNLEWATGFEERFGLFYTNRSDPGLKRVPKVSVQTYSRIIRCNGFPDPESGHECLSPGPTAPPNSTKEPERTTVLVTVAPPPGLSFLGLRLSAEEAEVGLNTTFALLVVMFVAALVAVVGIFMVRRRRNKRNQTF